MYKDASIAEVAQAMQRSAIAFKSFSQLSRAARANLMRSIAKEIEALGEELIQTTMRETHLPEARLKGERARTLFQLNSYADACKKVIGWKPASLLRFRIEYPRGQTSGKCWYRWVR